MRSIFGVNESGCRRCNGTGYKGRVGVHELLAMNDAVRTVASRHGAILVDLHALFRQLDRQGFDTGGMHLTTKYLGGLFGLDGVHLTNTGHAIVAHAFVDAINEACGTSLVGPDVASEALSDPLTVCAEGHPGDGDPGGDE